MAKRMTERQKRERARIKKELQKEGILPPDKKPLNRKKCIDEAVKEWNETEHDGATTFYLLKAFGIMTAHKDKKLKLSSEAVGAAKVLRLAVRLGEFYKKLEAEGRKTCTNKEKYNYIKDIYEA